MTIKVESFLALEASLTKRLVAGLERVTSDIYAEVELHLKAGEYEKAGHALQALQLAPIFEANKEYVSYITDLAMLFGASRVTSTPGTSVVGLGYEKNTAYQLVQTFQQMIGQKAEAYLKTNGMQLIAEHKASAESVQKAERVLQPFGSFMDAAGEGFFNMVSSLHTSRVAAYGFTAEAFALGLEEYQINEQLDSRICPTCRSMHGRVYKVTDARRLLEVVTRVTDPDDLKQLQPWPGQSKKVLEEINQMTPEEMVARGWHIPPFHPRCRGLLARVGKVPNLPSPGEGQTSQNLYTASAEDFKALGYKISADQLKKWNSAVGLAPAEVIAALKGQSLDQFMSGLLAAEKAKDYAGLKSLTMGNDVTMKLEAPAFGTEGNVKQTVKIKDDGKTLQLASLLLPNEANPSAVAKSYLQSLYVLAKDIGAEKIATTAASDLGGYAMAKYGFVPTPQAWETLKTAMQTNAAKYWDDWPNDWKAVYTSVKASEDPAALYFLADSKMGQQVLSGTTWAGTLDLTSPEAVERFLTYLGEQS